MRVLLSTFGSRGDVEPLAGLAAGLRALGAEVRVCAPPDEGTAALLTRAGATLAPAFMPVREFLAQVARGPAMDLRTRAAGVLVAEYDAIAAAADGCDAVLAAGLFPSTAAARCVAEARGIPYFYAHLCPLFLPSAHQRPHAFPGHPHPPEVTDNLVLWERNAETMNALFGEAMNALRARIGLPAVANVRDHVFTGRPWLAADPVVAPWRGPGPLKVVQTGAWILPDERPLPAPLAAFLEAGAPPVYVGFGSMPMQGTKEAAARAAIEAVRAQGRRVILSHGWADLALVDDREDGFAVGEVNQQVLFGRVAAVVHHGGAGTTTTATRAGAPQVVVPQFADQPYWAGRVAGLGIGAAHDAPTPTVESLSAALQVALAPETRARASGLAETIRADGAKVAATLLLDAIGRDRSSGAA
jgi:vancomycin aglycone glucosyltransferase